MIALRDSVPLRDALERLGIDTAPLDLPPPPEAVPLARIAPGHAFAWEGRVWTRATLDQALTAAPDRRNHSHVVAAYLAAVRRGRPATAFRWDSDAEAPTPPCVAVQVEEDELVYPVVPADIVTGALPTSDWISLADQSPDLGRTVTIDTTSGPVEARLLLDDEAAGGAAWHATSGERLDLDEASRWQSRASASPAQPDIDETRTASSRRRHRMRQR